MSLAVVQAEKQAWDQIGQALASGAQAAPEDVVAGDIWMRSLMERIGDVRGLQVLDCGCGAGALSHTLARQGARVTGFDLSTGMLGAAQAYGSQARFAAASATQLPFADGAFDLIVGAYVLHHVPLAESLPELRRVLKPGGRGVFVETWGKNPILRFMRRNVAGRFGTTRYGTVDETPLRGQDVALLRAHFPRTVFTFPELLFFKKAGTTIFRWQAKWRWATRALVALDDFSSRYLPALNQWGHKCVVEVGA